MSIQKDREYRDDMFSLSMEGCSIDCNMVGERLGRLDRPHILGDGDGEIYPASKLRSEDSTPGYSGRTLRLGPTHSHDIDHQFHLREAVPDPETDLIVKFRRNARGFRDSRRDSRDR